MAMEVMGFFPLFLVKWLFLVGIVWSSLCPGSASQACHPVDLLALKDFAGNLTNGSIISTWSNDSSCCNWDGVFCRETDNLSDARRVIMLNVSDKGVQGVISHAIGNLEHLKLLDLSHNYFEGELPAEFSKLKQLEFLDLSHNVLTGPAFHALAGLESIRAVNLSSNSFNGSLFSFVDFRNLVALNLSNNFFSGGFNSQVCSSSKKIQFLDLSMNHFTGGLEGLGNCSSSLQQLYMDYNSFSGSLPEALYTMSSLEHFSVSANNLSGPVSQNLSKLSRLETLILNDNQFYGPLPDVFENLTQLKHLVVHSNSFSGLLPSTLTFSSNLRKLDLRNNSLSGTINLDFTRLPNLCELDLGTNHFEGALPESLSSCQKLKSLNLAKNELSGEIPENYANLSSLSILSLSNNSFVNLPKTLSIMQHWKNLTTLILAKNFRGEDLPNNISGFHNLKFFALGNCALKGQVPAWLFNCSKLQILDLSWNHLNGSIPQWIGHMESLFYLDFSNNTLTGEIPKSLAELKSLISANNSILCDQIGIPLYVKRNQSANGLQYKQASSFPPSIILSNNRINGSILPDIGKLKQLHVLDLSRNNISGTIPTSISDMENLEVLDLSSNNLYGSIPSSFNKLTFLSRFSVANNRLRGAIPTGGQFLSFSNSSFDGNPGLCGTLISPCGAASSLEHQPKFSTGSGSKLGRGTILGITVSIGVGVAILLAFVVLRLSKRNMGDPVECFDDDFSRPNRLSGAFGSSKLVFFQNSECQNLTVADLLKSTNNFNQANIIGCGGFGLVYKAELPSGIKAAIKRLSGDCGQVEREFQAEVEALSRAQHKNLVSLRGYCQHGTDRLLIYSYMENGSLDYWLHERIDESSHLTWDTRLKIAQGAARGLAYLHKEPKIVHRDVKTSNILLDERFEAHLADFGLSRLLHPYDTHVTTDLVGTLGYIPPEYSQSLTATFRGDVYSFGVVLLELLTARRPVEVCKGKNCRDLVSWIFQMKSEKRVVEIFDPLIWDKDIEKQLLDVLVIACKCIDHEQRRRPSIDQVVSWLDVVGDEGNLQ
ncbi:phytosulfokine receptor 2 [Daucus carota subsp. sativus]|nr:PREDICTED: phytosulfokine receptor 2 [Daucus carota subsp. sativus]